MTYVLVVVCVFINNYFIKQETVEDHPNIRMVYSVTILLIWSRMLLYLRGFRKMSLMIRLIMQVIKDIIPFCIIVFMFITMFGISCNYIFTKVFVIQNDDSDQNSVLFTMKVVYCMMVFNVDWFINNDS